MAHFLRKRRLLLDMIPQFCVQTFFSISQTAVEHLSEDRELLAVDLELELDASVKTTLHGYIARCLFLRRTKFKHFG